MKSDDGASIPASMRSRVDFPEPLGPEIAISPAEGRSATSKVPATLKGFVSMSPASAAVVDLVKIPVQLLGRGLTLGLDVILLGIAAERREEFRGDNENEQALPKRQAGKSGDVYQPEMAEAKEYGEHGDGDGGEEVDDAGVEERNLEHAHRAVGIERHPLLDLAVLAQQGVIGQDGRQCPDTVGELRGQPAEGLLL